MTRARVSLAIAFTALAITACGGGDGDGNGTDCTTDPTGPGCAGQNRAPTAVANGPYTTTAGGSVTLTAAGSTDPEDQPGTLKYEWLLNNAVIATGAQTSYVFTTAGNLQVTLRVTDTKGLAGTAAAQVTVTPAPPSSTTSGTLAIFLTDAPFPFDSVQSANMGIVRVDARRDAPTAAQLADLTVGSNPATGWVTVATANADQPVDLLPLQGGRTRSLGLNTAMPIGSYSGFRIVLDASKSNLTLRSGARATVTWPAPTLFAAQITAPAPVVLNANGVINALVDFDLGRSFAMVGATPGAGGFQAAPSLRLVPPQQTGTVNILLVTSDKTPIEGASTEVLLGGTAAADQSRDKLVATGRTDANGVVTVANLAAGTYAVRITGPVRLGANTLFVPSVTVSAGGAATYRAVLDQPAP